MSQKPKESEWEATFASVAIEGLGHVLAISVLFAVACALALPGETFGMVRASVHDPQMSGYVIKDIAIMLALATIIWAVFFTGFSWVRDGLNRQKTMAVHKTAGTIVTETLIVLPVFLLLTFGIAQMGINSMAGLLTTVGTFQAARTIAVWAPEQGTSRTTSGGAVSSLDVIDRAKIAAATVIAPVAPMSAGAIACSKPDALQKLSSSMVAAGLSPAAAAQARIGTFSEALDSSAFAQRGPTKLAAAFCSMEVSFFGDIKTSPGDTGQGEFTTNVTYNHKMVMPLVGLAFGGTLTPGGWQTSIERSYRLHHHLTPNPESPKTNDIL